MPNSSNRWWGFGIDTETNQKIRTGVEASSEEDARRVIAQTYPDPRYRFHTVAPIVDAPGVVHNIRGRFGICRDGDVYRVAEIVTSTGHYITHQEGFTIGEAAMSAAIGFAVADEALLRGADALPEGLYVAGGVYGKGPGDPDRRFKLVSPSGANAMPYITTHAGAEDLHRHTRHHAHLYRVYEGILVLERESCFETGWVGAPGTVAIPPEYEEVLATGKNWALQDDEAQEL
jgi:hypothetical protein